MKVKPVLIGCALMATFIVIVALYFVYLALWGKIERKILGPPPFDADSHYAGELLQRVEDAPYGLGRAPEGFSLPDNWHGTRYAPSPNRRFLAYTNGIVGNYHVHIWDEAERRHRAVVSVGEASSGSGMSHYCAWSDDSRMLFVLGYGDVHGYGHHMLPLIYDVESDALYSAFDLYQRLRRGPR